MSHFSCCVTAGEWCCEWPFLRVTLDKHCATSHRLLPRRPTLELLWETKLHLCLKECVPAYQSKGHCQGTVAKVVAPCSWYIQTSFRQPSTPKATMGEGIKVSNPFFPPPHPSHLSNAKYSKKRGLLQVFSTKNFTQPSDSWHTQQLFHIVQTYSCVRDNSDSNEHIR